MILEKRVTVNGKCVTELGTRADLQKDHIKVDGKLINFSLRGRKKEYLIFHKPAGVITSISDEEGRPVVMDYIKAGEGMFPVGRLDFNSEGLLIITNDGDFCKAMTDASGQIERVYEVKIRGKVEKDIVNKMNGRVRLDDGTISKPVVKMRRETEKNTWLSVSLKTGRNREVRRIMDKFRLTTVRLKRIKYGPYSIGTLTPGEYRKFTADEVRIAGEITEKGRQ